MSRIVLPCCIVITLISLASSYVPVKGGQHSIKPKEESASNTEHGKAVYPNHANVHKDNINLASLNSSLKGDTFKSVIEDANKNTAEELNHKSNTFKNNRQEHRQINKFKNNSTVSHTENHHMNNGREEKSIFKEVKEHSYHDEVTIRNHVIYKHDANFDEDANSNQAENEYEVSVNDEKHKVSMSNLDGKNVEHQRNEEFVRVSNKENPSKYHIEQHSSFDGLRIDDQEISKNHQSEDVDAEVPLNVPEKVKCNYNADNTESGNPSHPANAFNTFGMHTNTHNSEHKHAGVYQQNEEQVFQQNSELTDNLKTNLNEDQVAKASGMNLHDQTHKLYEENWRPGNVANTFGNFNKNANAKVHNSEHKYAFQENGQQSNSGSNFNDYKANSDVNEAQEADGYQNKEERLYQKNSNGFKTSAVNSAHKQANEKTDFHEDAGKDNGMNSQVQPHRAFGEGKHRMYQDKSNINNAQNFNNKDVHYKSPKVVKIYEDPLHDASLEKGSSDNEALDKGTDDHKLLHSFHHDSVPCYHDPVVHDSHHPVDHHGLYDTHHSDHYHPHSFDHSLEDFDDYHDSHSDYHRDHSHHGYESHSFGHGHIHH